VHAAFAWKQAAVPPHVPPLQGSASQHCAGSVQEPPAAVQVGPPQTPPLHGKALQQSDDAVHPPPDATHCVVPPPFGLLELHDTNNELTSATSSPVKRIP
jgi:hypothetical protein